MQVFGFLWSGKGGSESIGSKGLELEARTDKSHNGTPSPLARSLIVYFRALAGLLPIFQKLGGAENVGVSTDSTSRRQGEARPVWP